MATLDKFKVTTLPTRLELYYTTLLGMATTPGPIIKDVEYDYLDLSGLKINAFLGTNAVGHPLDTFLYQIRDSDVIWSEDIKCTVNRDVAGGTPAMTSKTIIVPEEGITDITSEFNFDTNTDRVLIEEIAGNAVLTLNGLKAPKTKEIMIYDFINIFVATAKKNTLFDPLDYNYSEIKFKVGKYGIDYSTIPQTVFTIKLTDLAGITEDSEPKSENLAYNEYSKVLKIVNGVPNGTAEINITPSSKQTSFIATVDNVQYALDLTNVTSLSIPLNNEGRAEVIFSGIVPLTNSTDTYSFYITIDLLSISNDSSLVDNSLDNLLIIISSEDKVTVDSNIINSVTLISENIANAPALNYLVTHPDTGGSIKVIAVINMIPGLGQGPFTYTCVEDVASAIIITQQTTPNEFEILGLTQAISNSDTTDATNKKYFTVTVTDINNIISTLSFQIEAIDIAVSAVPTINSASTLTVDESEAIIYQITASENPTSFRVVNLPTGLSVSSSGLITGSIATNGSYNISLYASNAIGESTPAYNLAITVNVSAPEITNTLVLNANVGESVSFQLTATDSPTSYSATGLPTGLSLNTSTGLITGSVSSAGTTNVTINATNGSGTGSNKTLVITILTTATIPNINSSLVISYNSYEFFSYEITALNSPTSFNATGLPTGLLTHDEFVTGKITTPGFYTFTISATNEAGTDTEIVYLEIL